MEEEKRLEEERIRREEEEKMRLMNEIERAEYLKWKNFEEEAARIRLEEEKRLREEQLNKALTEAKRIVIIFFF